MNIVSKHTATVFDVRDVERFVALVQNATSIALTCHLGPDGDALGSSLGMAHVLRNMGKDARVITPDEPPHYLRVLPGARNVMALSSFGYMVERIIADTDLILCMDYNELSRISRLEPAVAKSAAPKVLIDHHKHPADFADITFSYPEKSSTCELTYQLLEASGLLRHLTLDAATCLMGGILTDTGGMHYNANSPELYRTVGELLQRGVDKDRLVRYLVDTQSAAAMQLQAYALSQKMQLSDYHSALITLDRDELNRFGYKKGDTEGLVNKPLAIPGVIYSCYLRQEKDYIKVSMRSIGDFPVDHLCRKYFGGGGHLNAAGGEFYGSMQQAVDIFNGNLADNASLITAETLDIARRQWPQKQNTPNRQ